MSSAAILLSSVRVKNKCRVSTVREKVREKNIFSRSGNCQGILKFVREFWNLSKSQGKSGNFEITSQ